MRHLLNTLFVLTEDCYLTLDGENVVVSREKAETARFPLHTLESILCFTYPGASPSLMGACAGHGIDLCFFSPRGRFLARAVGEERGMCCCAGSSIEWRTVGKAAAGMPGDSFWEKCTTAAGYWARYP